MSKTSKKQASKAGAVLNDPKSSAVQRSLAGSALRQTDPKATTSPEVAEKAGKALDNPNSAKDTKSLAGSVLNQTEPKQKS